MKPPSKKELRAAIEQLKGKNSPTPSPMVDKGKNAGSPAAKKSAMRIRKQGI